MSAEIWKKIEALDLSKVRTKLSGRKGWWWNWWADMNKIEAEYRQFLYLIATNPGKTVVPWSEDMDAFWHEHILDTAKYNADCQNIFGKFVHHNPHLAVGTEKQVSSFKDTKQMYREAFGKKAEAKSYGRHSSDVGCTSMMPVVFCGGFSIPDSHDSHSHSSHDSHDSHSSDSSGSSCGSSDSSGGSSCGSSCGGSSCGGGGCGGGD